jgi:predicted dehydrogenase
MLRGIVVSRRDLLKGAAALVLAGPYVITSSALGAPGRAAASNRLTMAHIGIGNQGSGHFGGMLGNGEVQILAVCDVRKWVRDRCQKAVEDRYAQAMAGGQYKGCAAYNDFRDVAARSDIDAVVIAVPDHWHALVAIEMAKSGKDIYCEKPLALTVRQARAMVTAVRRYGRVFQTGSQQRSDTEFRTACELVRNGRIGQVKHVGVSVGGPSTERQYPEQPIPDGMDWDMWLGPAPWAPYNEERCSGNYGGGWRLCRDYSGGMMTDWGAHHFDIAQWGLGMDDSGPVEIHPPDGKNYKRLTYIYANGIPMTHGDGGAGILFTGTKGTVEVTRGWFKTNPPEIAKEPLGPNDIRLYHSRGHMADWFQCVKTRRRPICDVEVGCRSVTVCHLGNIAYWLGRSLKWDPVKEEIIGDEEASRWLDRPMRAPWRLG